MSISAALANALSGLTATGRMASLSANNIANALTEGYAPRTLAVSTRASGSGGIQIDGVIRHADPILIAERRDARSNSAEADTLATFRHRAEALFGTPEDGQSLTALYTRMEIALVSAASRPDLPERLSNVLSAAGDVALRINGIEKGIQALRTDADAEIAATVTRTNDLMSRIADLNVAITETENHGGEIAGLMDLRQQAVDELSTILPVRSADRAGGAIALYTPGGAILVDGQAAELGFTPRHTITAHMTRNAALLSGLTLNGVEIDPSSNGKLGGGRLGALFDIRDTAAVTLQSRIDAAARDLVERFQDTGLDPSLTAGAPGLFTDNGTAFAAADEIGLAGRIAVNAAVDPSQGGETWRLRDGLGAAAAGLPGASDLLQDFVSALRKPRVPGSGPFGTGAIAAEGVATTLLSFAATDRRQAEDAQVVASARAAEVEERFLATGVDTDHELQRLLQIEQAYAANARMIQTLDDMMDTLLRIG